MSTYDLSILGMYPDIDIAYWLGVDEYVVRRWREEAGIPRCAAQQAQETRRAAANAEALARYVPALGPDEPLAAPSYSGGRRLWYLGFKP